jgi:hypothetical protein
LNDWADPNPEVGREDGSLFILLLLYEDNITGNQMFRAGARTSLSRIDY